MNEFVLCSSGMHHAQMFKTPGGRYMTFQPLINTIKLFMKFRIQCSKQIEFFCIESDGFALFSHLYLGGFTFLSLPMFPSADIPMAFNHAYIRVPSYALSCSTLPHTQLTLLLPYHPHRPVTVRSMRCRCTALRTLDRATGTAEFKRGG
jgi:hypothetical protein